MVLTMSGCQKSPKIPSSVFGDFDKIYDQGTRQKKIELKINERYDLHFDGATIKTVSLLLKAVTGEQVIFADVSADSLITADFVDEEFVRILSGIARLLGLGYVKVGQGWYVGKLSRTDRVYMVGKIPRTKSKQGTREILGNVISESGTMWADEDGVFIVFDNEEGLERVRNVIDELGQAPGDVWVVQLYVWRLLESRQNENSIEIRPGFELSARLAEGAGLIESGVDIVGSSKVLFRYLKTYVGSEIVSEPLILVRDGGKARLRSGTRVPFIRTVINSENGVVETVGVEFVETGLTVDVSMRDYGAGDVLLDLTVTRQNVLGEVGELPITSDDSFQTSVVVRSGGTYLLGQLLQSDDSISRQAGIGSKKKGDKIQDYIWGIVYRIGGGGL